MSTKNADSILPAEPSSAPSSSDAGVGVAVAESPPESRRASRRRFLSAGATLAAASLASASRAFAQQGTPAKPPKDNHIRRTVKRLLDEPPKTGFDPYHQVSITTKGWDSALVTLVRRITNGITPGEMTLARKLGFYGYLNYHLNALKIDDVEVQSYIAANFPNSQQDSAQLYSLDQGVVKSQFVQATLYRAAFSKRQLLERMTEFWNDHFNINYDTVEYMKVADDRDVARKYALGSFYDLVKASAHSPAMLEYLDNTRNRRGNTNQNYARELMELHTLGVDGGYTQDDVDQLARCLTGWTIAPRGVGFVFDPTGHDFTAKTVLGQTIPAQPSTAGQLGAYDGDFMIDFLLKHPSTAKFVSKKMLRWLLRYDPSDAQITDVASVYTKTKGDIPSMIRAILTPTNLTAAAQKYRRPYSYILAALRGTGANMLRVDRITGTWLNTVGQSLFAWATPDGYPDKVDYWAGGVLQRWNFATYLTTNTTDAVVDINAFMSTPTPTGVVDAINTRLFGDEMPDNLRARLMTYAQGGTLNAARVREVLALALSSSTFQWI
jgi:uncharacterized protein (DUF1800 family)